MRLLTADRIIVGDGERVLSQGALVIDDRGKIAAVGPEAEVRQQFRSAPVSRYDGCTLLPGLIDLHVHIGYWWNKPDHAQYNDGMVALMTAANLREALSLGVTTIRDVAAPGGLMSTLKHARKTGFITAPRLFGVNQLICMTGGHGYGLPGAIREANGPWDVRAAVREQVRAGADWIKVTTSHRTHTPEFTQEELDAAVDESHRLGRKCCVHASLQPSIPMAIKAGFDTIEHATFMTVDQAKAMAEKGLVWVPTMVTFFRIADHARRVAAEGGANQGIIDESLKTFGQFFIESEKAYRENFASLMETGVTIATGTDIVLDKYPITPVAEEVGLMVELGMQPIRAIQAATATAAAVLDQGDQIGKLAAGLLADILVVKGDPLTDIKAMQRVQEVFLDGASVHTAR